MKKIIIVCGLCLLLAAAAAAQVSQGGTLYVAAKSVALKSSTGFFARTLVTLGYGTQVTVLQVNGKWVQVRSTANASQSGWTASSNLSAKRIVAGSSGSASANEIALAGKGFNQEIENVYKADGRHNYADVDRTETMTVSPDELYKFLTEGHLNMGDQ
ncbi:MAG: hypothetical protein LBD48_01105 [Treponema sp.]|jgi:uncharacterized protein YgiM (DUF1202 family)|nr:hypothetical protein [Treponema sp.]